LSCQLAVVHFRRFATRCVALTNCPRGGGLHGGSVRSTTCARRRRRTRGGARGATRRAPHRTARKSGACARPSRRACLPLHWGSVEGRRRSRLRRVRAVLGRAGLLSAPFLPPQARVGCGVHVN
jgi:hypothetical protein